MFILPTFTPEMFIKRSAKRQSLKMKRTALWLKNNPGFVKKVLFANMNALHLLVLGVYISEGFS